MPARSGTAPSMWRPTGVTSKSQTASVPSTPSVSPAGSKALQRPDSDEAGLPTAGRLFLFSVGAARGGSDSWPTAARRRPALDRIVDPADHPVQRLPGDAVV